MNATLDLWKYCSRGGTRIMAPVFHFTLRIALRRSFPLMILNCAVIAPVGSQLCSRSDKVHLCTQTESQKGKRCSFVLDISALLPRILFFAITLISIFNSIFVLILPKIGLLSGICKSGSLSHLNCWLIFQWMGFILFGSLVEGCTTNTNTALASASSGPLSFFPPQHKQLTVRRFFVLQFSDNNSLAVNTICTL